MAGKQTANPSLSDKKEANKSENWFPEEVYHAVIHYSLFFSLGGKKKKLKKFFVILSLSIPGVIQVQEEYWFHHKDRDKFLKNMCFKSIPQVVTVHGEVYRRKNQQIFWVKEKQRDCFDPSTISL